jgi:hypothetical protein
MIIAGKKIVFDKYNFMSQLGVIGVIVTDGHYNSGMMYFNMTNMDNNAPSDGGLRPNAYINITPVEPIKHTVEYTNTNGSKAEIEDNVERFELDANWLLIALRQISIDGKLDETNNELVVKNLDGKQANIKYEPKIEREKSYHPLCYFCDYGRKGTPRTL